MVNKSSVKPFPKDGDRGQMEKQWRIICRDLAEMKKKYAIAHDKLVLAEAKSHDNKLRAKGAENSLKVLEQDAHRFRWLKKIGSEAAIAVLKPWETDTWDHVVDKARGHIQ